MTLSGDLFFSFGFLSQLIIDRLFRAAKRCLCGRKVVSV